ncbi:hypothetical protein GEMRC1_008353 [Eukaryota sp. GEM-RC1]
MANRGTVFRAWAAFVSLSYCLLLVSVFHWSESNSDPFQTEVRIGLCYDNSLTKLLTIDSKAVTVHENMYVILSTSSSKSPSSFTQYSRVLISVSPRSYGLETVTTMQDLEGYSTLQSTAFKSVQLWDDSVPITSVPPNTELYHSECANDEDRVAFIAVSSCHLTKPLCGLFFQKIDLNVYGFLNNVLYLQDSSVIRSSMRDVFLGILAALAVGYIICGACASDTRHYSPGDACLYDCCPEVYESCICCGRRGLLVIPLIFLSVLYFMAAPVWHLVAFAL